MPAPEPNVPGEPLTVARRPAVGRPLATVAIALLLAAPARAEPPAERVWQRFGA